MGNPININRKLSYAQLSEPANIVGKISGGFYFTYRELSGSKDPVLKIEPQWQKYHERSCTITHLGPRFGQLGPLPPISDRLAGTKPPQKDCSYRVLYLVFARASHLFP